MPELVQVEGWRRLAARRARGRRVRALRVLEPRVLRNVGARTLARSLRGARLGPPRRHGKWLLLPAGQGLLALHFGMSGSLSWSADEREERYDRLLLVLEDGCLHYGSRRKLGGLWWIPRGGDLEEATGALGPDASTLSAARLRALLGARRGALKPALMDQALVAGLGNELVDEILWRARLRPTRAVAELSRSELDALHGSLRAVLRAALPLGDLPREGRWLQAVRRERAPRCPRCGAALRRDRVGGRTSLWCPREQR